MTMLSLSLPAGLIALALAAAQAAADPLLILRPVDAGEGHSMPYASGQPMDLEAVYDPEGLWDPDTDTIHITRSGYYRQSIVSDGLVGDAELGHSPRTSEVVWINAGATARVRATCPPPAVTVRYIVDRTLLSWEYLGAGIPPLAPGARTSLSAVSSEHRQAPGEGAG